MLIRQFAYSWVLLICNVLGFDIGYTMHNELHSQAEGVDLCTLYEFTFSILPSQWPITNTQVDVCPETIVNEKLYLVYCLISAWEGFCYLENSVCNNQIADHDWWFIKSFFLHKWSFPVVCVFNFKTTLPCGGLQGSGGQPQKKPAPFISKGLAASTQAS